MNLYKLVSSKKNTKVELTSKLRST